MPARVFSSARFSGWTTGRPLKCILPTRKSIPANTTAPAQAGRVGKVAEYLWTQGSPTPTPSDRTLRKLNWATQLHEIGCQISHSDYHKHGAYILDNADVPGFAVPELHRLGLLVLGHRGMLRKLDADFEDPLFVRQLLVLRLAVILCHARRMPDLEGLQLQQLQTQFLLQIRPGWSLAFPQSAHLLREEVIAWQKMPWTLALDLKFPSPQPRV